MRMRELWDVFLMGRGKRDNVEDRRDKERLVGVSRERLFARTGRGTRRCATSSRPGRISRRTKARRGFSTSGATNFSAIAEAVAPVIYGTRDRLRAVPRPSARPRDQAGPLLGAGGGVQSQQERGRRQRGRRIGGRRVHQFHQPEKGIAAGGGRAADRPNGRGNVAGAEIRRSRTATTNTSIPTAKPRVPKFSRREAFAEAATTDNPLLARAFVNRMWAAFIGRGIVHPADEMNGRNEPSHPELLDWLAQDFAAHGYDIRRVVRGHRAQPRLCAWAPGRTRRRMPSPARWNGR